MRSATALLVLGTLAAGCSTEGGWDHTPAYVPSPGSIEGRVCAPDGSGWQADVMAYTNIYDREGRVLDVRVAYTDRDGTYLLDDLRPNREYTVYLQQGPDLLDEFIVWVGDGDAVELEEPNCLDPLSLNIALITGSWDDIHRVLEDLGFANCRLVDGEDAVVLRDFLLEPAHLARFDVVVFNGGHVEEGVLYTSDEGDDVPETILQNLRDYVAAGGSVYASDWSYDLIERAWPHAVDFLGDDSVPDDAQLGEYDLVTAHVTDVALSAFLGKTEVLIEYDLPVWPPITAVDELTTVHLTGTVHFREGASVYELEEVPLLVTFSGGEGRVGYATYRVAANHGPDMVQLLQYAMHQLDQ